MKALTLMQPWATLVAYGYKNMETRSWRTRYRGRIAIHAAKAFPQWASDMALREPFARVMHAIYGDGVELDLGAVLCTAELVDCFATDEERPIPARELPFGDFSPGRYVFVLQNVHRLSDPVPARGALGLWEWLR